MHGFGASNAPEFLDSRPAIGREANNHLPPYGIPNFNCSTTTPCLAMATPSHVLRLSRDYRAIQKSPVPYVDARPSPVNILSWSYLITGPPDTPYVGGQYYGHLLFPATFPYAAPSITMTTPSGRFNPNSTICTTFTSLHPEAWNPAWTVETILMGFLSFMTGKERGAGVIPNSTDDDKREFASMSKRWNSLECIPFFAKDFPDAHAANLATEEFTEAERKILSKESDEDTTTLVASEQETLLDNSYESHMKEDWDKFGSMEDDFDYYEDEEDDNEDHETSDAEIDNGSQV
jgi:ubiquitin-conjugating enzyme E2 J2